MFQRHGIIKDQKVLSFDYVPKELPHREEQLKKISLLLSPVLTSNYGQNVCLIGPTGTGKTVTAKRFCQNFIEEARKQDKNIHYEPINCRQRQTNQQVLLKLLRHFDENFPDRGFSIPEMLDILKRLLKKMHMIIVLDEADALIKKSGTDLIYSFTRFGEENGGQNLSLILISQKNVIEFLDEPTMSSFKRSNIINFKKYNTEELYDIVKQRVELACYSNVISNENIELIAKISAINGDARYAIEILGKACLLAEAEVRDTVSAEHIRSAKGEIEPYVDMNILNSLDLHKKLALLAIARKLARLDRAYASMGEVENVYNIICEEVGEKPRAHTQFWKYINELAAHDIILIKKSGGGTIGSTTLISISDLPALVLEKKLEEILRGKNEG
ncbi:MAG: AAA family ATPase [Candidatus Thermoplasmatota archaeon]